MKSKLIICMAVLAAVALISGASILAAAPATPAVSGAPTDPSSYYVTFSYFNDIFKPQIIDEIGKTERDMSQKFDAKLAELESKLQTGGENSAAVTQGSADRFSVVTLSNGKSLTCSVGAEIMLRIGTANGFGSAPALVDYTDGTTLTSGSALVTNHMYLITIEGNGVKATSDTVKVLVRGVYTVR